MDLSIQVTWKTQAGNKLSVGPDLGSFENQVDIRIQSLEQPKH